MKIDTIYEQVRNLHQQFVESREHAFTEAGIINDLLLVGRYTGQLEILHAQGTRDPRILELMKSIDSIVQDPASVYSLLTTKQPKCRSKDKLNLLLVRNTIESGLRLLCSGLKDMRFIQEKFRSIEDATPKGLTNPQEA